LPFLILEDFWARFRNYSANFLLNSLHVDATIVDVYRKVSLKKLCTLLFRLLCGTFLCITMIIVSFWFFRSQFFISAPILDDVSTTLRPTIVTIATNGHSAKDLVQSIRTKGQFFGEIYVIGDECSDQIDDTTIKFIQVEDLQDGFYKDDTNKNSKQLKQKLFKLIDEYQDKHSDKSHKKVEQILYLDSDVDVNAPLSSFIASIGDWDIHCNAYMFRERWYTRSAYSTVILFLDREHSSKFLNGWGKVISNHPEFPRDHLALSLFLARDEEQQERDYTPLPPPSVICELPLTGGMTYGSDFVARLRGTHATTFTHTSHHEYISYKCD